MREVLEQATRSPADLIILLTGDLVLDADDPDHWLSGIAPALQAADLAIGHLEVPHTRRGAELVGDVPASAPPPEYLDALARAGFALLTLGGNHIADRGPEGIEDTIERLESLGIAHTGAGSTLEQARKPATVSRGSRQIAVLSYNCVGPEAAWASGSQAGCNYLRVATANGSPVAPSAPLTTVQPDALAQLRADVSSARQSSDLVVVALHKGIVHTPARLAPYEKPLATAALAAGADIVVGHHAHILRGIEVADGRPVFHGLGNACVVTKALDSEQEHPARAAWAKRRKELFGFEPDPRYPLAPFHPEAVHGVLGVVVLHQDGELSTGVITVFVEPPGRPVCVRDERADAVIGYVRQISEVAELPACQWTQRAPGLWMAA